jgi:broad specificity phosphatase PhoE
MSFGCPFRGGFNDEHGKDQHAANAGPIDPRDLAELERYERDPRFHKALQQYQEINSDFRTPFLGGSSKGGGRVYQDSRYAQRVANGQIRLNGRPYDPTPFLFLHEAVEGVLIRVFGLNYPTAHRLASVAERLGVEKAGIRWGDHTAAMRPEIRLAETESGSGTPPDLLVDPYKGTRYDKRVEANETGQKVQSNASAVPQAGASLAPHNQPAQTVSGQAQLSSGGFSNGRDRQVAGGFQPPTDDWPPGGPDKGAGMRKFYLIRHGKTALNASNQADDKIRGWKDVPLDATGKEEAVRLGDHLKDSGINFIAHSNMKRSKDTAEEIARTTGAKVASWPPARPWNVGVLTGESSGKVHPELRRMALEDPDQQIPEGESFTQFKCRVFAGLGELLEKSDGKHLALVTHHRVERLIHAWIAAGQPTDMSIDYNIMFQHGEAPANADVVALDPERVRRAAQSACAELNKQGFQKYTHKAAGYHEGFGPPTPEHPEGSHCGVCRYFQGKDKCMIVEPPIGADDGCALFMPKGTKTGDGGGAERDNERGGYMQVRGGRFGSTNWDEREGPGGGAVTGAPPRARAGGYDPMLPANAPGQLQGLSQGSTLPMPPTTGAGTPAPMMVGGFTGEKHKKPKTIPEPAPYTYGNPQPPISAPGWGDYGFGVFGDSGGYHRGGPARLAPETKTQPQSGGYGAQSYKPNYSVGAGGPPKAPQMKTAVAQHNHILAKGGLIHALKAGHIDKETHDKAMASIDGALSKLKASKPKMGSAPKPKAPRAAPAGGAGGGGRRMGSLGGALLAGPLPDFMGDSGGFSPGPGPGSFMGQGGQGMSPMGGQVMPWQK